MTIKSEQKLVVCSLTMRGKRLRKLISHDLPCFGGNLFLRLSAVTKQQEIQTSSLSYFQILIVLLGNTSQIWYQFSVLLL